MGARVFWHLCVLFCRRSHMVSTAVLIQMQPSQLFSRIRTGIKQSPCSIRPLGAIPQLTDALLLTLCFCFILDHFSCCVFYIYYSFLSQCLMWIFFISSIFNTQKRPSPVPWSSLLVPRWHLCLSVLSLGCSGLPESHFLIIQLKESARICLPGLGLQPGNTK